MVGWLSITSMGNSTVNLHLCVSVNEVHVLKQIVKYMYNNISVDIMCLLVVFV